METNGQFYAPTGEGALRYPLDRRVGGPLFSFAGNRSPVAQPVAQSLYWPSYRGSLPNSLKATKTFCKSVLYCQLHGCKCWTMYTVSVRTWLYTGVRWKPTAELYVCFCGRENCMLLWTGMEGSTPLTRSWCIR